jgi:hypothetical protein
LAGSQQEASWDILALVGSQRTAIWDVQSLVIIPVPLERSMNIPAAGRTLQGIGEDRVLRVASLGSGSRVLVAPQRQG